MSYLGYIQVKTTESETAIIAVDSISHIKETMSSTSIIFKGVSGNALKTKETSADILRAMDKSIVSTGNKLTVTNASSS